MQLRIGHLSTFYHTAILLMAESRTSERTGCEVIWRLFGTGPGIVEALERGELDIAYIGLPPAIIGMERGAGISCVAGGHMEGTVIAGAKNLVGYPEVEDLGEILTQLRGHTIGVPGKGSIHDVILSECLSRFNLSGAVAVRNFTWADEITEAMATREVSAAFGTPALATAARRFAQGKILYPPRLLWPENPSYGIVVSNRFLNEYQSVLELFLTLHEEATSILRNTPVQAAKVISEFVGFIDEDFVLETIRISPKYCAQLTDGYIASTMKFVVAMRDLGYISRALSEDEIFEKDSINKVHGPGSHYNEYVEHERI